LCKKARVQAREVYFTISSPLALPGQYSMPGPLITKNAENDKITKYDDTPIGVDSKKRRFQPDNAVFLHVSQGKKNFKNPYFYC